MHKSKNLTKGVTLIEYALLIALIGVACMSATRQLSGNISNKFCQVGQSINIGSKDIYFYFNPETNTCEAY